MLATQLEASRFQNLLAVLVFCGQSPTFPSQKPDAIDQLLSRAELFEEGAFVNLALLRVARQLLQLLLVFRDERVKPPLFLRELRFVTNHACAFFREEARAFADADFQPLRAFFVDGEAVTNLLLKRS